MVTVFFIKSIDDNAVYFAGVDVGEKLVISRARWSALGRPEELVMEAKIA